jgi:hypothetical protein
LGFKEKFDKVYMLIVDLLRIGKSGKKLVQSVSLFKRKWGLKKYNKKQRLFDVRRVLKQRRLGKQFYLRNSRRHRNVFSEKGKKLNDYIDKTIESGMHVCKQKNRRLELVLPETMNLSSHYEETMLYINAIRRLSKSLRSSRYYRLAGVCFDHLKHISSSAALLLTSELSRWDDSIRNNLRPKTKNWDPIILEKFNSLGFFDLFRNPPKNLQNSNGKSNVHFVRYVKGNQLEKDHRNLKRRLSSIVGNTISKWTFLHSGLDEAVTNVCHHAYPDTFKVIDGDKNWYLTGAFDDKSRELKVVFCDQGIGIPNSLPSSKIWEKVLKSISKFPPAERKSHSTLIKAAMEVKRTRTDKTDRGKGLPDMKEFIKQRGEGYLAIMSGHGLYKLEIKNGKETHKTDTLKNPIMGTCSGQVILATGL